MEAFLEELSKVVFGWWWYCEDGQSKAANSSDRYIVPLLVALSVGCCLALVIWKCGKA